MVCTCRGKYYALNVPLKDGITDADYESLFKPIVDKVLEVYQPSAVVFQSGDFHPFPLSSSHLQSPNPLLCHCPSSPDVIPLTVPSSPFTCRHPPFRECS